MNNRVETDENGENVKTPRQLLSIKGLQTPEEEAALVNCVQIPANRHILVSTCNFSVHLVQSYVIEQAFFSETYVRVIEIWGD